MTNAPISLDHCFPRKIALEINPEGSANEIITRCQQEFAQNKENERQWQVILSVSIEGKEGAPGPFTGRVEYVGVFSIDPSYPAEKMPKLVAVTCPSILYSAIREMIALLTGRGPHRALLLPTVSFQDVELTKLELSPSESPPAPAKPRRRAKGAR